MKEKEGKQKIKPLLYRFQPSGVIKIPLIRTDKTHPKHVPSDSVHSIAGSNSEEKIQNISMYDCYDPSLKNLKKGTLRNII